MKKKTPLIFPFTVGIIILFSGYIFLNDSNRDLIEIEGQLIRSMSNIEIIENKDIMILEGVVKNSDVVIKIIIDKNVTLKEANLKKNNSISLLLSIFNQVNSPYPGIISNQISCSNEYHPKEIKIGLNNYLLLYASKELNYGACSKDLIYYQSIYYYLYCNNFSAVSAGRK